MRSFLRFLPILAIVLPAISHATDTTPPAATTTEAYKIEHAIATCKANQKVHGCDTVLLFANAVDMVDRSDAPQPTASANATSKIDEATSATSTSPTSPGVVEGHQPTQAELDAAQGNKKKSTVAFSGSTDTKNAKINWTAPVGARPWTVKSLGLTIQTPIDQGADFTNVATLDGLAKSTTLSLQYSIYNTKHGRDGRGQHVWTVNATYGTEQHTFYNSADLSKSTVTKYPFQLGVSFDHLIADKTQQMPDGTTFVPYNSSIGFSYNYQSSFKDGQSQVLCPASNNAPAKCASGFIDAPTKSEKNLITLNYKAIYNSFAITPSLTYDASSHHYGIELPVYIVPTSSDYPTAGIQYDWNSDKHESVIGIFVSSPLCLAPGKTVCSGESSSAKN